METIYTSGELITMFVLFIFLVILSFIIKYFNGDYSPISIEEISRDILENKSSDNLISKKIVITYKKIYKDGRVKITTKTIN